MVILKYILRSSTIKTFSSYLRPSALDSTENKIFRLDGEESKLAVVAADLLRAGKLLALPTDTVYGLAACAGNHDSAQQLYHVKGRENAKPLAICVGRVKDVYKWGKVTIPDKLLHSLLPGPVTLLLQPQEGRILPLPENPKLVGIRVPDHKFSCAVARELDFPIALTSANISGQPSSLNIEEFIDIWPKLSAIFDGGAISCDEASRSGSTVLDLSQQGFFRVVRAGVGYKNTRSLLLEEGIKEILEIQ